MIAEVDVRLGADGRGLLQGGVAEWSGPARCSPELALLLGFPSNDRLEAWPPQALGALAASARAAG